MRKERIRIKCILYATFILHAIALFTNAYYFGLIGLSRYFNTGKVCEISDFTCLDVMRHFVNALKQHKFEC